MNRLNQTNDETKGEYTESKGRFRRPVDPKSWLGRRVSLSAARLDRITLPLGS